MICENIDALKKALAGILAAGERDVRILDEKRLRGELIDDLIQTAVLASDVDARKAARWLIRRTAAAAGVYAASIQGFTRRWVAGGLRFHRAGDQHPRSYLRHRPSRLPGGAGGAGVGR